MGNFRPPRAKEKPVVTPERQRELDEIKLLADKPVATMTLRDILRVSHFMDSDPTDEELSSIGLPSKLGL